MKIIVFILILGLLGYNEHIRYRHLHADCMKQQSADRDLLNRDVCFIYEDRVKFQATVDCDGAERRLRVSVVACAIQRWIVESNATHLVQTLTGSFWALFATIMVPLLFSLWLWKSRSTELAIFDRIERLMKKQKHRKPMNAISYK